MDTFHTAFAAFNLGGGEMLILLFIVLLLFGGAKLPQLARGLGQSMKEFKKAAKEGDEEETKPVVEAKKPAEVSKTHTSN
jgi:sec-independent protein translocase protein TatA